MLRYGFQAVLILAACALAAASNLSDDERRELASSSGSASSNYSVHSADDICDREAAAHDAHEGHAGHHNYQLVLFGLSIIFLAGAVIEHFVEILKVPLPYTMLLLCFGLLFGIWILYDPAYTLQPGTLAGSVYQGHIVACNVTTFVANDLHNYGHHLGNAVRTLAEMDPHLLLHLLLPPLLFESAFAIDWHIFYKVAHYGLFLALPGLVICTMLTGVTYMLFYRWEWEVCMLIGGILSATDPVAVVALLREMGVKKSLATLIEAESLLNDGTAVVVYSILLRAVQCGSLQSWLASIDQSGWYILWMFFRMAIIGPLFGASCAFVTLILLERRQHLPDRDPHVETVVTIAAPFLVFYVAETAFGDFTMSGVLSVVSFGLTYASPWGKMAVDPRAVHFMHTFWGMIGHIVNLIVFVLAGCRIILKIGDADQAALMIDLGYGLVMYVLLAVFRGIVMYGVIPLFRHGQYGYDWKDALIVTWGGLRGDVGLALAVAVYSDDLIADCDPITGYAPTGPEDGAPMCIPGASRVKQVCLMHVCLVVLLTLVVNASTVGSLLKMLGMTKQAPEKEAMVHIAQEILNKAKVKAFSKLATHPVFYHVIWPGMERLTDFDGAIAQVLNEKPIPFDPDACWTPDQAPKSSESDPAPPAPTSSPAAPPETDGVISDAIAVASLEVQAVPPTPADLGLDSNHPSAAEPPTRRTSREDVSMRSSRSRRSSTRHNSSSKSVAAAPKSRNPSSLAGLLEQQRREREQLLRSDTIRLLSRCKAHGWVLFTAGLITPRTSMVFNDILDDMQDDIERHVKIEPSEIFSHDSIYRFVRPRKASICISKALASLGKCFERCGPFSRLLFNFASRLQLVELNRSYDVELGYYFVIDEIIEEFHHGTSFSIDEQNSQLLESAMAQHLADAKRAIDDFTKRNFYFAQCVNTLKASRRVLNLAIAQVDEMKHHGGLAEAEADRLATQLKVRASQVFFDSGKALAFLTGKIEQDHERGEQPNELEQEERKANAQSAEAPSAAAASRRRRAGRVSKDAFESMAATNDAHLDAGSSKTEPKKSSALRIALRADAVSCTGGVAMEHIPEADVMVRVVATEGKAGGCSAS